MWSSEWGVVSGWGHAVTSVLATDCFSSVGRQLRESD